MKMVTVGDCGPGGVQATAIKCSSGMDAGPIQGSAKGLLCAAMTYCGGSMAKGKLFSGGETGEILMHDGAPFKGQGQAIERYVGEFINAMAICHRTNRLYVGTSGKKLAVFNTETGEKISQAEGVHGKSVMAVVVLPEAHSADVATCSSDNTIKLWSLDAETNELKEEATLRQVDSEEEEISR